MKQDKRQEFSSENSKVNVFNIHTPTQQKTRQATPYWETNNMNTRSFQRKLQFNVRCTLNQKQMQKEYKHIKHVEFYTVKPLLLKHRPKHWDVKDHRL